MRPWFVAASSGPKDVILLIDTSDSMTFSLEERPSVTRWDITRDALLKIVGTFGPEDYINIVTFNNLEPTILLDEKSPRDTNVLFQATEENIARLRDAIKGIIPDQGTDFRSGFATAFDILIASEKESDFDDIPPTSQCEKVSISEC